MSNYIETFLSKEDMESLSIPEEANGETKALLMSIMDKLLFLNIKPEEPVLLSDYFKNGDGKRYKTYVKGLSYKVLETMENKMTDFQLRDKTYRLLFIRKDGTMESIPIFTHMYLYLTIRILMNPRFSREFLDGMDNGKKSNISRLGGFESLDLSDCDTSHLESMAYMFLKCNHLENLELCGIDTSNVTDFRGMLQACGQLTTLDLSGLDTSKVTDIAHLFRGCYRLRTLDLSGWNLTAAKDMEDIFTFCDSLRCIYMEGCNAKTVSKVKKALLMCGIGKEIVQTKK